MEIKQEWEEFITTMSKRMAEFDKRGAEILYADLIKEYPPDKSSLEWSKAYIGLNHSASKFAHVCLEQNRLGEAILVNELMEAMGEALSHIRNQIRIPKEFVKEVKF